MATETRLSELTGIGDEEDDLATHWGLNVAVVLLGGALVGVAFYFLNPTDKRLLYNPWTYVVVTPVLMSVISGIMSTLVSRVVEKSMQLAMLLSVLVHILLLVYATNIVIFSRVWPDLLESIAKQRHELKKQALQANQYFRVSSTNQTGRRPEYLSYVPTQHQPTEVVETESPALVLAKSEVSNLVSPDPKIELANNPHLVERAENSPSSATTSEQAASLARSEIARQMQTNSAPEQMYVEADVAERELAPSENAANRRSRSATDLNSSPELPRSEQLESSVAMSRAQSKVPDLTQDPSFPEYQVNPGRPTPAIGSSANVPDVPQVEATASQQGPSANQLTEQRSRSSQGSSSSLPQVTEPNRPSIASAGNTRVQRADQAMRLPMPNVGSHSSSISRDSAGGRAGLPGSNSMRVFGPTPEIGSEGNVGELAASNAPTGRRRSETGRQPALALPGSGRAPNWDGSMRLAPGGVGSSPGSMIERANGDATADDIAQLSGRGSAIERTKVGAWALSGAPSMPSTALDNGNAPSISDSPQPQTGRIGRRSSGTSAAPLDSMLAQSASQSSDLGSNFSVERRSTNWNPAGSPSSDQASGVIDKASQYSAGPTQGEVQIPSGDALADQNQQFESNPDGLDPGPSIARRTGSGQRGSSRPGPSLNNLLAINGPTGFGGLAPEMSRPGTLLPRRNTSRDLPKPVELDTQRFARRDIGGPLAGGQNVAVPKPAFKQRMERLKDRDPLDETSVEPQTELAIERGLEFLAKHQRPDGSWRLQDFDTEVLMRSDTAATALAVLSFQGAGYTHLEYKYADNVDRALKFLVSHQTSQGDLYIPQDPASDLNAKLYSHGIASLALCEAYGMTQDENLKAPAQAALNYMNLSQDRRRGGWRYEPGVGSDTSVTGWFMMAFKSGQLAGLDVSPDTFARIQRYLDTCRLSADTPYLFRYNPFAANTPSQRHGLQPTAVMTSVGLLMRLYFDWRRDTPEMMAGTDYLMQYIPQHGTVENSRRDTYYWYYATQVMYHMGGERWKRWHDSLYPLLIDNQVIEGEYYGSWNPVRPTPDLWARYGGRLYVTTLNLLSLEVSYRHLPLYEATGQ